jgi:hypothetical protein
LYWVIFIFVCTAASNVHTNPRNTHKNHLRKTHYANHVTNTYEQSRQSTYERNMGTCLQYLHCCGVTTDICRYCTCTNMCTNPQKHEKSRQSTYERNIGTCLQYLHCCGVTTDICRYCTCTMCTNPQTNTRTRTHSFHVLAVHGGNIIIIYNHICFVFIYKSSFVVLLIEISEAR